MMAFGAVLGVLGSVSGMYISYYWNIPSGAAIVLVVSGLFMALLFSPSQGILTKPRQAKRLRQRMRKLRG